jgi:hypothetical protein
MRHRHDPDPLRVLEVVVVALHPGELPAGRLQFSDDFRGRPAHAWTLTQPTGCGKRRSAFRHTVRSSSPSAPTAASAIPHCACTQAQPPWRGPVRQSHGGRARPPQARPVRRSEPASGHRPTGFDAPTGRGTDPTSPPRDPRAPGRSRPAGRSHWVAGQVHGVVIPDSRVVHQGSQIGNLGVIHVDPLQLGQVLKRAQVTDLATSRREVSQRGQPCHRPQVADGVALYVEFGQADQASQRFKIGDLVVWQREERQELQPR